MVRASGQVPFDPVEKETGVVEKKDGPRDALVLLHGWSRVFEDVHAERLVQVSYGDEEAISVDLCKSHTHRRSCPDLSIRCPQRMVRNLKERNVIEERSAVKARMAIVLERS